MNRTERAVRRIQKSVHKPGVGVELFYAPGDSSNIRRDNYSDVSGGSRDSIEFKAHFLPSAGEFQKTKSGVSDQSTAIAWVPKGDFDAELSSWSREDQVIVVDGQADDAFETRYHVVSVGPDTMFGRALVVIGLKEER